MISQIDLCLQHARRIDHRSRVLFRPGYNVVVGPNATGKSTLLEAIYNCSDCQRAQSGKTRCHYFNSEIMNPHRNDKQFRGIKGSIIKIRAMFSSHGETMRDVLHDIPLRPGECFLLDEPEAGHDLEWIIKIRHGLDMLTRKKCQVIVASHHPVFWKKAHVIELKKNYLSRMRDKYQRHLDSVSRREKK